MITKLTVKAFKSLAELELELGQVNVLIGANGSGKSNLLEAIGVLGAAASGRVDDGSLLRRGVRPGVPALYKTCLRGIRMPPFVQFGADWARDGHEASYRVGLGNPIKDPAPAWQYRTETLEDDGVVKVSRGPRSKPPNPEAGWAALHLVEFEPASPAASILKRLQEYVIYSPTTATLRGLVPDSQTREPVGLSGGRLPEAVLGLLRARRRQPKVPPGSDERPGHEPWRYHRRVCSQALSLIDWATAYYASPRLAGVLSPSVPSGRMTLRFQDRFMRRNRDVLTAYDASEGALYVLMAAVLGAHPEVPPFLAVDNFDHSLNPRLACALVERFCGWVLDNSSPRQVLLTTHNPLVLDGLDLTDERIRLFAVDRTSKGRTVVQRVLVDEALMQKAREGWTLSRLWVMGEIGGVPNV